MTRSAWVTVRLPGARTAPPTSTRIWFQTGAVKHGRKTASQDSRIGGTVGWSVTDSMRFCVIESVESSRPRRARAARYIGRHRHATRHQIVASPNVNRNGRSDHSTYRVLPLLQGDLACGTSQPRLYALPCPVRRVGRTFASDRIGRQVRSALLVALEGPMGLDGPVRTHRPVNRRRTTLHRPRGYLLGYHLTAKRMKNAESRAKTCLVQFDKNKYSVMSQAVGRPVEVYAYAERIVIRQDGRIVADHLRCFGREQTIYDPWHYVPVLARKPGAMRNGAPFKGWVLPGAVGRLRQKLRSVEDGDRQMVKILTAVLADGMPAVEAACAEALNAGLCSSDVVLNALSRQRQPALPPAIAVPQALALRHAPVADCARYDTLRRLHHGTP